MTPHAVFELRRYRLQPRGREPLIALFDREFVEPQEALGIRIKGEFRDADDTLRMVAIMDRIDHGLSAVYTFYDPDWHGSLGTYGILWQLDYAARLGLPWLYLGYWIGESRKMAYKSRFKPHQILRGGVWAEPPPDGD